jgi:hypothetical protein
MIIYSVSVYKDNRNQLIIIPNAFTSDGVGQNVNKPIIIDNISDLEHIGDSITESLIVCKAKFNDDELDLKVHEIVTGKKGWASFYKQRNLVVVCSDLISFITIQPTQKILKERSYAHLPETSKLEYTIDNVTLAEKTIEAFNYCK